MPEKQDKLDIETTVKPRTPPRVATPPAAPATPSVHDTGRAPANLDIETTITRPQAPAPPRAPTAVPPPMPQPPSDASTPLPIGYVLDDKFVITKILGRGGLGVVYRATERQTGVEFAIKVVAPELANDADARNDLRREVANAQQLTHQNLLKINYLADSGPTMYLVMEYIEGENLEEYRVRKGAKIMLDDFRKIVPQILAALDYLHDKGVVHCDVKPQNIMVTPFGEAKLTDFGIARTIKEQLAQCSTVHVSAGTLAYMAPEQIRGDGVCDRRTDIYSVGIMLYRLLKGEFPFASGDRERIIQWHIDEKHLLPSQGRSALDCVIQKMLSVLPAERYSRCADVLKDFTQAWNGVGAESSARRGVPTTSDWWQLHLKPYDDAVAAQFYDLTVAIGEAQTDSAVPRVIPLARGTEEEAVRLILPPPVAGTAAGAKPNLPLLSINCENCSVDHERLKTQKAIPYHLRYMLSAWALRVEEMDRIVQQVVAMFDEQTGKVIFSESGQAARLTLDTMANNLDGAKKKVIKYQFGLSLRAMVSASNRTSQAPSGRSTARQVEVDELFLDPGTFDGQLVTIRGVYDGLYTRTSRFQLRRKDLWIDVHYRQLPKEQQRLIIQESEAKRHPVIVEGLLDCDGRTAKLTATDFAFAGAQNGVPAMQIALVQLFAEPNTFDGRFVKVEGEYASLYSADSSFKLVQGDHHIWVFYSRLPEGEKQLIMRDVELKGYPVLVEGILVCDVGEPRVSATRFAFR